MNPSDDEDDLREEATEREKRKARRRLLRAAAEVQRLCPEDEENDENEKENASRAAATAAAKAKSRAAATEAKRLREGNRYLRQELVAAQRLMTGYHAQLMTGGGVRLVDASSTTTRAGGARSSGGSLLSFSPEKIGAFPWEASLRASSPAAARGSPVSIRADAVSLNKTRDVVVEGGVRTANRAAAKKLAAGRAAIPGVGYEYLARADVGSDRLADEVSELRKLVRKMADRDEKKDAGTSGA